MKFNPILLRFYASCALSSWGDRIWFFALSMYLSEINKGTLLINAIDGFLGCACVVLFGPVIGGIVDKSQRITVVRTTLFLQNTTVAVNCIFVVFLIIFNKTLGSVLNGSLLYVFQGIMIFLNIISNLSSMATSISIERDWVIVIAEACKKPGSQKTSKQVLTNINAMVRRIDLTTSILAPIFAGAIMSFANLSKHFSGIVISAMILACWNIGSFFVELFLLKSVYKRVPELKKNFDEETEKKNAVAESFKNMSNLYKGWYVYIKQGVLCLPGLALSTLFLTVLSFDTIMIAYAKNQQLSGLAISVLQGCGAFFGIFGTFAFPLLHNKMNLKLTAVGMIGSMCQLTFLTFCVVSLWMPGSPFELYNDKTNKCLSYSTEFFNTTTLTTPLADLTTPILTSNSTTVLLNNAAIATGKTFKDYIFLTACKSFVSILMLLSATALSRFGLWLFDLAVHQIIQEAVTEKERGIVGGVQRSINQIFQLIKFVIVIFLPNMSRYGYLVIFSYCSVFTGFTLFTIYTSLRLFHRRYHEVPQMDPLNTKNADDNDNAVELKPISNDNQPVNA